MATGPDSESPLRELEAALMAGDLARAEREGEAIRRQAEHGSLDRASAERLRAELERAIGELTSARGKLSRELKRIGRGRHALRAYRSG